MKTIAIRLSILVLVCFSTPAAIIQVNNNTGAQADFSDLQAAHDAAQDGDTFYVHGSTKPYGKLTVSKRLQIIGPGYFLADNPQTQMTLASAQTSDITFSANSEGSSISGIECVGTITAQNVSNIFIRRNKVRTYISSWGSSNILIFQNYVVGEILVHGASSSVIVKNNIAANANSNKPIYVSPDSSSVFVEFNTFGIHSGSAPINIANTTFRNNIVRYGSASLNNSTVFNNLFLTGDPNGQNIAVPSGQTFDALFAGGTSSDGKWQLEENSIAKGIGDNGSDLGAFGGPDPYVLSGIPSIPSIFFMNAPTTVTSFTGLNVHVKAKANR